MRAGSLPPKSLELRRLPLCTLGLHTHAHTHVHQVKVMEGLKHVNIITYVKSILDRSSGNLYIIMEYADGGDLQGFI